MRLSELVGTSARVAEVRGKKAKVGLLAGLLRRAGSGEAATAVAYLSGQLPQGRIGIGPAALRAAMEVEPAGEPALTLAEVDAACSAIAAASGPGSQREKVERLGALLGRATAEERSTWWCSPPNGATAGARGGSRTSTSAPATPSAAASSCSARPSRA